MTEQIDLSYIDDVADGNKEVILKLLGVLQKNLQNIPLQMRSEFDAQKFDALRKTAHKLKSSTASIGIPELTNTLKAIEVSAENGDTSKIIQQNLEKVEIYSEKINEQITDKIIEIKLGVF